MRKTAAEFLLEVVARDAIIDHLVKKGLALKVTGAEWSIERGITDIEVSSNDGNPTFKGKIFQITVKEIQK